MRGGVQSVHRSWPGEPRRDLRISEGPHRLNSHERFKLIFLFLMEGGGIFNSNPQSILREVSACPHDPKAVSFRLVTFLLEAPGITSINEAVF